MILKLILLSIILLLTGCYDTGGCTNNPNIFDNSVIKYVGDNLRVSPPEVRFLPVSDVQKACSRIDVIGCYNHFSGIFPGKPLVYEGLTGKARVEVIAHEIYHWYQVNNGLPPSEFDAKNYGLKIANNICGKRYS